MQLKWVKQKHLEGVEGSLTACKGQADESCSPQRPRRFSTEKCCGNKPRFSYLQSESAPIGECRWCRARASHRLTACRLRAGSLFSHSCLAQQDKECKGGNVSELLPHPLIPSQEGFASCRAEAQQSLKMCGQFRKTHRNGPPNNTNTVQFLSFLRETK